MKENPEEKVVRKVTVILMFLVLIAAGMLYFIHLDSRNILTDPYKLVPPGASFFLESSNLPSLLNSVAENNGLYRELSALKGMEDFNRKFGSLRAFLNRTDISPDVENQKSIISFYQGDGGKHEPLLVMTVPKNFRFRHFEEIFQRVPGIRATAGRRGTNRVIMVTPEKPGLKDTVYFSFISGLALCTSSVRLLDKVAEQKNAVDDIRSEPGISKLISSAGNREDKLYIIFRNLGGLTGRITGGRMANPEEKITRLAGCAEGDISISENGYLFSGYSGISDSSEILNKYINYPSASFSAFKILPADVVMFETTFISDESKAMIERLKDSAIIYELAAELLPLAEDEITRAVTVIKNPEVGKGNLAVYLLKNREAAERSINERLEIWMKENNLTPKEVISYFQPDDQTKIPIFQTPFKGLYKTVSGNRQIEFSDSLITFYDNYMITGDRAEALEKLLYENLLNKTISNDVDFREFETTLPSKAAYFFYCTPVYLVDFLPGFLNDSITLRLKDNPAILRKIKCVGFQMASVNGMIYNTLSVKYAENVTDEAGTEWETRLDGMVVTKPFFFVNHNTGAREIVVQDEKNNLYLINAAGRILWKIAVGERICGNIFMVDFYGNGKYQILFGGKENLYLIDRNGNHVDKYPVRLRSPASGPPALFDYDNNLDYRIFVPGEDRLIYAYDKFGNVVKGWKPFKTGGPVKSEIKFFRVSGKDFIVASDANNVWFLDRMGNIRLKTSEPVTRAAGSEIRLNQGAESSLVFTSPDGTLISVSFDGKVRKTAFGSFGIDHTFDLFDIDGDGYGEYLFIDAGKLYLYDHDKGLLFVRDFGTRNLAGPFGFVFSPGFRRAGVYDQDNKLVYMVDKKGNYMKGFPLRGFSAFSVGKFTGSGVFHLIVGGNDNFLYNYKLNIEDNN